MKLLKTLLLTGCILLVQLVPSRCFGGIAFTTLVSCDGTNGSFPLALVQAADGNLYGTTQRGGIGFTGAFGSGNGAVFKMAPDGLLTNLVSFDGTNGSGGLNLIQGTDGNFFGTTFGTNGTGTLFKLNSSGVLINSSLASFDFNTNSNPVGLAQDKNGVLFGTTQFGSDGVTFASGTVFKINTNGVYTHLTFFNGTNGHQASALVQGGDGNFYGTTLQGGAAYTGDHNYANTHGTVFRITPNGILTSLFSFDATNGAGFNGGWLVAGADGNLYGTTSYTGSQSSGYGAVFKMTTNGSLIWSIPFNGIDGLNPKFLMQFSDGNLYGTTTSGGDGFSETQFLSGYGTVFKITSEGLLTTLLLFHGTNGQAPFALVQGSNGCFYGTTQRGGPNNNGTIYRLSVPIPPVFQTVTHTTGMLSFTWSAVAGQIYQPQYNTNLNSTNWINLGDTTTATNGTMSASDPNVSDSQRFYRVVLLP